MGEAAREVMMLETEVLREKWRKAQEEQKEQEQKEQEQEQDTWR